MNRLGLILGLAAALAAPAAAQPRGGGPVPPARSGDVAIRQELEAARRTGTREAYDLFIARHGNHPLAAVARRERARLATQP